MIAPVLAGLYQCRKDSVIDGELAAERQPTTPQIV